MAFSSLLLRVTVLFFGLALSLPSLAQQAAPTWLNARTLGAGFEITSHGATASDAAGNIYRTGTFFGTLRLGDTTLVSNADTDGYLAKYAPNGTRLWVRQLGAVGNASIFGLTLDAAGNAYITGDFSRGNLNLSKNLTLTGNAFSRLFVARYSSQGALVWGQQSTTDATGFSLVTDAAGSLYLAGNYYEPLALGTATLPVQGEHPAFLARLSTATGVIQHLELLYSYTLGQNWDWISPCRLVRSPTGALYVLLNTSQVVTFGGTTTLTPASENNHDIVVVRYDSQGRLDWARQFGGPGADFVQDGIVDATGNLYLAGNFTGPTAFGAITLEGAGRYDAVVTKVLPTGDVQWAQGLGGLWDDSWNSVNLDAEGNPYLTGYFTDKLQVDDFSLVSAGSQDVMVASYTPKGQIRGIQRAGGPEADLGLDIEVSPAGEAQVFGSYSGRCAFAPYALQATATNETFQAHLSRFPPAHAVATGPRVLGIYPNPATDLVNLPDQLPGTPVDLLDVLGRVVQKTTVSAATQITVGGLSAGLYTLRATDAEGRQLIGKLMVE